MHRRALLCLAVPAASFAARSARAFREATATAPVASDFATRCRPNPREYGFGQATICPFCGCPVVGARDHGETARVPGLPPG